MKTIVLASHNRDKAVEFRGIFGDLGIELQTLDAYPQVGPIEENAPTLEGNALKKAREVFLLTGIPSLADDTGLEVRYLNDAPGVLSSRYAGPGATYSDNIRKLLNDLRGVPPRRRGAQFRCVLALVAGKGKEDLAEGNCRGVILERPQGKGGFGYDPLFLPQGFSQTFAEMDLSLKNTISHRARAAMQMKAILKTYLEVAPVTAP
jgi:XTP/dITP diphosphohydrolase